MPQKTTPRDRLIETAARLFYARGLPNVGINEVTECAGVARMTLYNNFKSKEDLALAAMAFQSRQRKDLLAKFLGKAKKAEKKIAALFDVAERLAVKPTFRGCAFINVAVQIPNQQSHLHELVRSHKLWVKDTIEQIANDEYPAGGERLAQQILCLWDGAIIEAYIQGSLEPILAARDAALVLFRSHRPERQA